MKKPNLSYINKQKNISMKSRKSTSPFSSAVSDPMNSLQNTYLKEKRINMIINFLVLNNYPNNFSKKDFINMTIDFRPILKFIMEKLDPNSNLLDSQTEDKIEALAKIYEYPGKLNKTFIRDFNTPSNFLYILTFMCYMANLCSYKEYFTEKEINKTFYKNEENIYSTQISEEEKINGKKEYYEFLEECINNSANNQENEVIEKYKKKFSNLCNEELNKIEKNFALLEQLEKENRELESQLPVIDNIKSQEMELMQKYNLVKDEYNKTNDEINMFNNKLNETQKLIKDQEKNLIILDNDIKSTRNIIDHQIMSRAEYDIKQEENNNILNKIESIKNDITMLQNQKKELINTNQNLINKLTIMANDINNIDINNSKKIKTMNDFDNNNENDISYLLNMTFVNKEIKNNINNNEPDKNKDLLLKYDDFINKYKSYITEIKNEYNNNLINNNELSKNKDLIKTEIDKYSNMFINNNKISNDRKELIYKINNEYTKYKKDNDDFINIIKNDIKILENNINDKRKKSVEVENEFNKLKKEFDEYKNETYKIINALMERYNLYYNNFIDNSNEITSKIINCNQNLNEIYNDLAKNVNKENERNENVIQKNK